MRDELQGPGWYGSCAPDPVHCGELSYWDCVCCAVALVAGAVAWFAAARVKRFRRHA